MPSASLLEGQVGLIVGGSGGIGSETARRLVSLGARVGLFARGAERLTTLASELGASASAHVGDALDPQALQAAVEALLQAHGRLDFLVHAVGTIPLRPLHMLKAADFEATWRLNALSPFLAMQAALGPMMAAKRGAIVCCSSVAAGTGLPNHEAIASAKGAVEGLVRAAAMTYAPYAIRINAVAPGLVDTALAAPLTRSEPALKASLALHPLHRLGTPDEVAAGIVYLLGAEWTTGVVLPIDGGIAGGRLMR